MKNIEPKLVFYNGLEIEATKFQLQIILDNLLDSAIFNWQLFDANDTPISNGNLTIGEPTYDQWGTQSDVNQWAYEWAATQLNLTLA